MPCMHFTMYFSLATRFFGVRLSLTSFMTSSMSLSKLSMSYSVLSVAIALLQAILKFPQTYSTAFSGDE